LFDAQTYEFKELLDPDEKLDVQYGDFVGFVGSPPALVVRNKRWRAEKREWESLSKELIWPSPDGTLGVRGTGQQAILEELPNGPVKKTESLAGKQTIRSDGADNSPKWYSWSPDSQIFAGVTEGGGLALFRRDGKFLRYLTGVSGHSMIGEFAPDGSPRFAAVGHDHTLRVWNTNTGRQLFCGVQLSADQAAILNEHGDILFGDPAAVERELIYMVEYNDGRTAILSPSEFRQLHSEPPATPSSPNNRPE
jgi:WD40 repeat protein